MTEGLNTAAREVPVIRNELGQHVRIPAEFELPGDSAIMHREGTRLVIEPVQKRGLLALLSTLEPIEDDFPDFDEGLLPARDVDL